MRKNKTNKKEENDTNRIVSENLKNVIIFPCLLLIPKVLHEEEFLHYLKETKERAADTDSRNLFKRDQDEEV